VKNVDAFSMKSNDEKILSEKKNNQNVFNVHITNKQPAIIYLTR
jgi:hypothetical protein